MREAHNSYKQLNFVTIKHQYEIEESYDGSNVSRLVPYLYAVPHTTQSLVEWELQWDMEFNPSKCVVIHHTCHIA